MKRIGLALSTLALLGTLAVLPFHARAAGGTTITVAPGQSIQAAIERAQPGDTIQLQDGTYYEDLHSVRDGRADAPITITGSRNARVVGVGGSSGRLVELHHSYVTLLGFTIDGKDGSQSRDKLLYIQGREPRTPLRGIVIENMAIGHAGGECVRLRYFVQGAEIRNNRIGPCGADDFPGGQWGGSGKNGEGVYIGTAPEQRGDGKNPDASPDQSNNNHIHHNTIDTEGNECVDIKEAATGTIVEYNTCTGQKDPESAGLDSRGSENIFRFNTVMGSVGAGIRLGGDTSSDGVGNQVYGNTLRDNRLGGVKVQRDPQGSICSNVLANNGMGASVGTYGGRYNPTATCPFPIDQPPVSTPAPTDEPLPPFPTTPPTRTPRPTQPPANPGDAFTGAPLSIEAERATSIVGGLRVVQDNARSGGAYVTSDGRGKVDSPPQQGARYDLRVASDVRGPLFIWVLGSGPASDQDSVYVRVGGGAKTTVHLERDWGWKRVMRPLLADGNTLSIEVLPREYGARVDAMVITTDPVFRPGEQR